MKIRDLITPALQSISLATTLAEAAQQMKSFDADLLPICEMTGWLAW